MLGTPTHDTKRGEDARARLAVLSEMPEEWAQQVEALEPDSACAAWGTSEGSAPPDRNDEYLFYQLLVAHLAGGTDGRGTALWIRRRCGITRSG